MKESANLNVYLFGKKMLKLLPFQTVYFLLSQGLMALIPAVQAIAIAMFVDNINSSGNLYVPNKDIIVPLFLIILCVLVQKLVPVLSNVINTSKKNRIVYFTNLFLLKKQTKLSYDCVEDYDTNNLVYRVRDNCANYFDEGYMNFFGAISFLVKIISLMYIITKASLLSGLIIVGLAYPLLRLALKTGEKNYSLEQRVELIKRRYDYYFSILTGKESTNERKLFGYVNSLVSKYNQLFDDALINEKNIINKRYANMKSGSVVTLTVSICIMAIMLRDVFSGKISAGLYIGVAGAILDMIQSMSWQLAGIMQNFAKLNVFLKDYNTFMRLPERIGADETPVYSNSSIEPVIEFVDVSFCYPGTSKYILKNCSFKLQGNKSYAFVGENGAGKTTIAKLLMGLYTNYEGNIIINGRNARDYSYGELKGMIGTVFQDFARYELSLKENIGVGDINTFVEMKSPSKNMERICQQLNMDNWINSLPLGYDTLIGKLESEGVDLSGGQWQKIAIARTMFKNAMINILDEPTAALDAVAESKIYELFERMNSDRLNILITHRMGAARMANVIMVLKNGAVIEKGSHSNLISIENGIYKKMYESQRQWYE